MPSFDRCPLLVLVLLMAAWTSACGDERIDVPPGGPGQGTSVGPGAGSGGDGAGDGAGGGAAAGGGGTGAGGGGGRGGGEDGGGGEVSWDTCETPSACLGDEPSICPENACESEAIFFTCPGSEEPIPAYVACLVAADLFRDNVWGRVVDCLRDAPAEEHCDDGRAVVEGCLASATADACPNPEAATTCATASTACDAGDVFPVEACEADLLPFGRDGLARYRDCLTDGGALPCADRHAACLDAVASF